LVDDIDALRCCRDQASLTKTTLMRRLHEPQDQTRLGLTGSRSAPHIRSPEGDGPSDVATTVTQTDHEIAKSFVTPDPCTSDPRQVTDVHSDVFPVVKGLVAVRWDGFEGDHGAPGWESLAASTCMTEGDGRVDPVGGQRFQPRWTKSPASFIEAGLSNALWSNLQL
jgi:hypothetical protein